MENVYQPPRVEVEPVSAQAPLFTPGQIGVAAFFGTLIASAWLARANFVALGQPEKGNSTLVKGVLITAGIMAIAFVLPVQVPGMVYTLPQLFLARTLADKTFGLLVSVHPRASHWRVAGVSLVSFLLIAGLSFGVVLALDLGLSG